MAFSSITQIGFILTGLSSYSIEGATSTLYFVFVYILSSLLIFGVLDILSRQKGKENLNELNGLYRSDPFLTWCITIGLFSLAGIPPMAGFFGKFFLLLSGASNGHYWLAGIAAVNMIIAFYYYLRIVRAMFMETTVDPPQKERTEPLTLLGLSVCLAGVIVAGLNGNIYDLIFSLFAIH